MSAAATLPGPRSRRPAGSMPDFRRDPLGFLEDLVARYGDLCGFRLYNVPCCVVNDPALIRELLVSRNTRLRKPWDVRQLRLALGDGLLTSEGERWERHRRMIQPAFAHARIRRYAGAMTARTADRLTGWHGGEVVDVHAEMGVLTLSIAADALFGTDLSDLAPQVGVALAAFMDAFERMMTAAFPLPLSLPTPAGLRARRAVATLDRIVHELIRRRRGEGPGEDLLSDLLATHDRGGTLDERALRDELVTLLLAGHETTALALTWSLYLLATHPRELAAAQAELDTVLAGRTPAAADAGSLERIRAVVREALRLYPPAWGVGREALEPLEIGGCPLRRGTQIFMLQYLTQRDARYFDDANSFRPARWLEGERQHPRYAYYPFGGGPRVCVGSSFAELEASLVLATILQRFGISPATADPPELQPAITLRPRHGLRLRLVDRY
ncbi:MAG TPA: cytochrome P450 [Gammaproteobacteria bacterium]|nr:cytochrome P450 [Gammaproteobacteria bacterium]